VAFPRSRRLASFAWLVLAYNIVVILWGAYVRASGSGAGCGSHWPLCNGEILPRSPSIQTLIEFSHRATSGLALLAVVALVVWSWRTLDKGHPARAGAAWALVFMLTEAAVGAGLVLFRLVADNASMARAMFMAVHLVNTFILVGWLTLTAHWASGGSKLVLRSRTAALFGGGTVLILLAGISGAVSALGDTLYPSGSLAEGLRADMSAASHFLIRLRIMHPAVAIGTGLAVAAIALRARRESPAAGPAASAVFVLVALQLAAGLLNLVLLAPTWMQIVHLLGADLVWIAYVLMAASTLAADPPSTPRASSRSDPRAWPEAQARALRS
jgi:cytochrome c oxidase assembly protein subunit 15